MIVVIGSPVLARRPATTGVTGTAGVTGLAGDVALAVAATGHPVQIVGRVGDDAAGDAILIALAAAGVGHAAVLRDAAHPTPVADLPDAPLAATAGGPDEDDEPDVAAPDEAEERAAAVAPERAPVPGLPLDAGDVALGLRYLTDFRVAILAAPAGDALVTAVADAAGFSGAHVIRLVDPADGASGVADDVPATLLEVPADPDAAFSRLVAAYAAALDDGLAPDRAFAAAVRGGGWERSAP